VPRWIARCDRLRHAATGERLPHAGDIGMLLQMIVGSWPLDLGIDDNEGRRALAQRLAQWQEKALREAKVATDWVEPNEAYENAARDLLLALVERKSAPALLGEIVAFAQRIGAAGAVNGLAQTLLKLTVPGVPDIYQGTEFWDFSLVDPDNRQPVDFAARATGLDTTPVGHLTTHWRNGRVKQAVIARTLAMRRKLPALFADGSYEPIPVRGTYADRVIAFARRHESEIVVVAVPRIASGLLETGTIQFRPAAWENTALAFNAGETLVDLFSCNEFRGGAQINIAELFEKLPVSVLLARAT
jgi:maltooligosyltrehalose synthase